MCTLEKRGNIFYLTLTGTDQHRLNPSLIATLRSHLATIRSQSSPGTVLITTAAGKFFSNGFDLAWANASSHGSQSQAVSFLHDMVTQFKELVADLVSLPLPTIAAVTGHAAAAGLLLAISHDYVMMNRNRGVMYMSEVDIGMTLPEYFTVVFREKVARPEVRRDLLLRGVKVKADEAYDKGLIDSAYDSGEKTVEAAVRFGEELSKRKFDGEVYAEIRKSLYPELTNVLGLVNKAIVKAKL